MAGPGALDGLGAPATRTGDRELLGRRILYAATSLVLTALMVVAVLDALGATSVYGVSTATVRATGGGYELSVRHPTVSRPALASPFQLEVRRPGGFDGPVTVAVSRHYLELWDANGLIPNPASETTSGGWVVWTFDAPIGDTLTFSYDARIEPAVQQGRSGRVAVFEADAPVAEVAFHTRVLP